MHPLVLASTSPYRRTQLARFGLPFDVTAPGVDERSFDVTDPVELAELLAREKARAVARARGDAVVIGADQVAEVDGRRLDKPGRADVARAQLATLAGRVHTLHTAVAVVRPGGTCDVARVTTRLSMRPLTEDEIHRYVDADAPLDCCGSYRIEGRGPALFSRIEGDDPTAIEGLPMISVARLLRAAGYPLP